MILLVPEFYLLIYNPLFEWVKEHATDDLLPKSDGDRWEYSTVHNGKRQHVTKRVLGYQGSFFYQRKMEATAIIEKLSNEEVVENPYIEIKKPELLRKIFLTLGCKGNNIDFRSMYEEFCKKELVEVEIKLKQDDLFEKSDYHFPSSKINLGEIENTNDTNNRQLVEAINTIYSFYKFIGLADYKEAWNLLYIPFQNSKIWKGDYGKFVDGYGNFSRIEDQAVFNGKIKDDEFSCLFYYEDYTKIHLIKDIPSFHLLKLSQADEFATKIKELINLFSSIDAKGFENMAIQRLFDPAASEYIWYKYGISLDKFYELFPDTNSISIRRLYKISAILHQKKWLISDIQHLRTYTVRD